MSPRMHDEPPAKVCGSCSASYKARDWDRLESCGAITSDEVKAIVTGWPDSTVIDLRRCGRCNMVLARRRT